MTFYLQTGGCPQPADFDWPRLGPFARLTVSADYIRDPAANVTLATRFLTYGWKLNGSHEVYPSITIEEV